MQNIYLLLSVKETAMAQSYSDLGLPKWPDNIGKIRDIKAIDGKPIRFTVLDEILHPETGLPQKLICFQPIRWDSGGTALRLGYYMLGWKEKRRGMWVCGQYSTFLDPRDLSAVMEEAKSCGWFE
ncbi:MAG TPA: hypothetical protein VFM15_02880 [Gammaproteobacteria bacterium]|nr:hypothetical protein [Gammaproteobacteria bacterium]